MRGDRRHRKLRDLRRVRCKWVIDAEIENNHFDFSESEKAKVSPIAKATLRIQIQNPMRLQKNRHHIKNDFCASIISGGWVCFAFAASIPNPSVFKPNHVAMIT